MINKPNFIIVGAPKCGSTSLYSYLDKHPDVFMSPIKEPGFLIKEYYQNISPKSPNYKKQFDYLVLEKDKYFSLFPNLDKHYHAFGEASVTYMFSPDLAIKNILKYIGKNVSIIIILRNPVDRCISQYKYISELGFEKNSFEDALKKEELRLNQNLSSIYAYKKQGLYFDSVLKFKKSFKNVIITTQEELRNDPQNTMNTIFNFLKLTEMNITIGKNLNKSGKPRFKYFHKILLRKNKLRTIIFKFFNLFIDKQKLILIQNYLRILNQKSDQLNIKKSTIDYLIKFYNSDVAKLEKF